MSLGILEHIPWNRVGEWLLHLGLHGLGDKGVSKEASAEDPSVLLLYLRPWGSSSGVYSSSGQY